MTSKSKLKSINTLPRVAISHRRTANDQLVRNIMVGSYCLTCGTAMKKQFQYKTITYDISSKFDVQCMIKGSRSERHDELQYTEVDVSITFLREQVIVVSELRYTFI